MSTQSSDASWETTSKVVHVIRCSRVDSFPDMNPEFSADIEVECPRQADVVFAGDDPTDPGGLREQVLCHLHAAEQMAWFVEQGIPDFGLYGLTDDHRQLYAEGRTAGQAVHLTLHTATVVCHEGVEGAGLLPAVEWADPWMLGYTDAVEWRSAEIVLESDVGHL
jgi:hypothetical protein